MEDKELDQLTRDPRYAGKLKKTSKKDKEALKDLFGDLKEEETYKDKRGRPWPKHPIKYAKQLIKEEEEEKTKESSEEDEESTTESDSDSSSSAGEPIEENLADLQGSNYVFHIDIGLICLILSVRFRHYRRWLVQPCTKLRSGGKHYTPLSCVTLRLG